MASTVTSVFRVSEQRANQVEGVAQLTLLGIVKPPSFLGVGELSGIEKAIGCDQLVSMIRVWAEHRSMECTNLTLGVLEGSPRSRNAEDYLCD